MLLQRNKIAWKNYSLKTEKNMEKYFLNVSF